MAKIIIHVEDTPSGGSKIEIQGITADHQNASWEYLQAKGRAKKLAPGAESIAHSMIRHITEQLAERKLNTIAPAPSEIPLNSFQRKVRN